MEGLFDGLEDKFSRAAANHQASGNKPPHAGTVPPPIHHVHAGASR